MYKRQDKMENGEHVVGKSVKRVDAFEKVTGRAKYTDDLCGKEAYVAKILHSTVAHGIVKSIDTKEAEKIPGVVKIVTRSEEHTSELQSQR